MGERERWEVRGGAVEGSRQANLDVTFQHYSLVSIKRDARVSRVMKPASVRPAQTRTVFMRGHKEGFLAPKQTPPLLFLGQDWTRGLTNSNQMTDANRKQRFCLAISTSMGVKSVLLDFRGAALKLILQTPVDFTAR